MSLYRCAACGSQKVMLDTQYNGVGYDYLRGAVGTVVLGVGGAAAGIKSQNTQVYKCTECGITLSYTMPEEIKLAIDIGVLDEKARSNLKLANGIPMYWDVLTKKFKNIEKGPADEAIEAREERKKTALTSRATASKEEFDKAVDVAYSYIMNFIYCEDEEGNPVKEKMTLVEHMNFHHACAVIIENVAKFFPKTNNSFYSTSFDKYEGYRGLHSYHLQSLFLIYLIDEMNLEGAFTLRYSDEGGVFSRYIKSNSVAEYMFNYLYSDFDIDMDNDWSIESTTVIRGFESFFEFVSFEEFGENYEDSVLCSAYIPKYIEKNGKVFCNLLSMEEEYDEAPERLKEDYFSVFPEKLEIYKEKLAEIENSNTLCCELEVEIEKLTTKTEQSKTLLKNKADEAVRLKNKIFGKKKALERAAELDAEVLKLRKQIEDNNRKIAANEEKIETIDPSWMYKELVKEMDYFVVWRSVEES